MPISTAENTSLIPPSDSLSRGTVEASHAGYPRKLTLDPEVRAVGNVRVLFDAFREVLDRHVMRGELDGITCAGALTVAVAVVGEQLTNVERDVSPARSGGEAEHRSATKSPAERASQVATTRTIERMARELRVLRTDRDRANEEAERLRSMVATVERQRDAARQADTARGGIVDLQARRITTLESVVRVMRAALQEIADSEPGVEAWAPGVFEALKEAGATLPDEASPGAATEPELGGEPTGSTPLELRVAGAQDVSLGTWRDFCEAYADAEHEWMRNAVRDLAPGNSVSFAGNNRPVLTFTRKAA